MYKEKIQLEVDDYLDLYLVAGKLKDQEWQQEIIIRLQNNLDAKVNKVENMVSASNDDDDDDLLYYLYGWY